LPPYDLRLTTYGCSAVSHELLFSPYPSRLTPYGCSAISHDPHRDLDMRNTNDDMRERICGLPFIVSRELWILFSLRHTQFPPGWFPAASCGV